MVLVLVPSQAWRIEANRPGAGAKGRLSPGASGHRLICGREVATDLGSYVVGLWPFIHSSEGKSVGLAQTWSPLEI